MRLLGVGRRVVYTGMMMGIFGGGAKSHRAPNRVDRIDVDGLDLH